MLRTDQRLRRNITPRTVGTAAGSKSEYLHSTGRRSCGWSYKLLGDVATRKGIRQNLEMTADFCGVSGLENLEMTSVVFWVLGLQRERTENFEVTADIFRVLGLQAKQT